MNRCFIAALATTLLCAPAFATDKPGRFTLDVKIDGSGHQAKGREHSKFTTEESLHAAFTLLGSGVPEDTNRLDIAGNAATLQKQIDEANARAPSREQQQAIMARAKASMEACKGDMGCMQTAAQALALQTASWSVRPPAPGANAGRFLTFAATEAAQCRPEFTARIRNHADGEFADVQGLVPFSNKTSADFKADPRMGGLVLCPTMLVVDTTANTLFINVPLPEIKGHVVRVEGSRTPLNDANAGVNLNQDAIEWVQKQLQGAPESGTRRTTLKIPTSSTLGGVGEKIINVEMRWSFDARSAGR